jgi:photosystem II stability/assembly factor-like uncharacterized protein
MKRLGILIIVALAGPLVAFAQWRALGPFGGDVQDVNISPVNSSVMLAGVAPGGSSYGWLFRSTDNGVSWARVPSIGQLSVYDIAFGALGTVWVGSDDSVWASTDNGATFNKHDLGLGFFTTTYSVAIDLTNPQVVWAGTGGGAVMKTSDGGTTWTNVTPAGAAGSCWGIAINPTNTLQVMVVYGNDFGGGGSVHFTPDGGQTWNNVSAGLPGNPMHVVCYDRGRWFLGGGILFGGQYLGLYRSTNNGAGWTRIDSGWPQAVANGIAVDPNDPTAILAATPDGVHKTTNGGTTWTISSGATAGYSLNNVRFAPGNSSRVALAATAYGVILSDDAAATTHVSSRGITSLSLTSIACNPKNTAELAVSFGGAFVNSGGVFASTNSGTTWQAQSVPPTRFSYVKFDQNGTLYALSTGPTTIAQEGVYRRNANGTWTLLGPNQGPNYETELLSIDFGRANTNLFIAGGDDFGGPGTAWRSTNAGGLWTKTLATVGQSATMQRVLILPDGADQIVLAAAQTFGSGVNGVWRSVDAGATWNQVTNTGLSSAMWGYDFATAPNDPHTVYVADGAFSAGAIYRSTDAGATWSPYVTGYVVRSVAVDPTSPDDVYFWSISGGPVYHASQNGTVVVSASGGIDGGATQLISVSGAAPRLLMSGTTGAYELAFPRPDLRIARSGSSVILSWTNSTYKLQAAPSTTGTFTNIPAATSPYTDSLLSSRRFYRLAK